ncbi:UNVERIFIED_CONTAM: Reticulon-like protein B17 [Sesamum latifolium]|uniref:Reticulon-like protein B17 n=1 Tax=Sesamum latifolium TaxID=2727402 RepID=A0AAW2WQ62_9LAMI
MADDAAVEACGVRKRCKSRSSAAPSPRSSRRSRRRVEQDMREERESVAGEEIWVKPRKKRHSERSRKDKSISVPPVPSLGTSDGDGCNLDAIGEMHFLIPISSGAAVLGSVIFLQYNATKGWQWIRREIKLKEDDILRVGRLVLPAANLAISRMREVFSGEPAMTLKVVPFLLVGAEYGHLITLWRLCALGFFVSFTAPKLYSAYSSQLSKKAEHLKSWALNAWEGCTHKKVVAASAVTAFWNLTSIRTRIFAAFLCLVILRYRRQQSEAMGRKMQQEERGGAATRKGISCSGN